MHTYILIFIVWKQNISITNLDNFSVMLWGIFSTAHIYHVSNFANSASQLKITFAYVLQ